MADILAACAALPVARFAPGDVLLRQGDPPGPLYVVIAGRIEVAKSGVRIVHLSGAGTLLGEMSVLLDRPISATVTAVDAVRAHRCDSPGQFLAETPEIALHAARLLAARLHAATTYIADLKVQFGGEAGHLGMMDRMLDAMLEAAPENAGLGATRPDAGRDPRL